MKISELPPLSVDETARFLAVSTRTVRRMVDRGDLRPTKIGGTTAFRWADVLQTVGIDALDVVHRTPPSLLTPQQAAERLDRAPADIRRLVAGGILSPVRIGNLVRLRVADIEHCAKNEASDAPRR